jgi:hypothetical protein
LQLYFSGDDRYNVKVLKDGGYEIPDFLYAQYSRTELKDNFTFSNFRSFYSTNDIKTISFFEDDYKCSTIREFFELEIEEKIRNLNIFYFLRTKL